MLSLVEKHAKFILCPRCNYRFKPSEVIPMTSQERKVLEALRELRGSPKSPVGSRMIADHLGYSQRWVQKYLGQLRRLGAVDLPRGRCSGWVEVNGIEVQELLEVA